MTLVDTNILVMLVIETPRTSDAARLLSLSTAWHSEHFILAELTNVLSKQIRGGFLTLSEARSAYDEAADLMGSNLHNANDHQVLEASVEFKITAYDARYIALAQQFGVRLVTEDRKLRSAAPELTQSLDEALERLQSTEAR